MKCRYSLPFLLVALLAAQACQSPGGSASGNGEPIDGTACVALAMGNYYSNDPAHGCYREITVAPSAQNEVDLTEGGTCSAPAPGLIPHDQIEIAPDLAGGALLLIQYQGLVYVGPGPVPAPTDPAPSAPTGTQWENLLKCEQSKPPGGGLPPG
jgi:hypothetical protein